MGDTILLVVMRYLCRMRRYLVILILCLWGSLQQAMAQNLVTNPGFEEKYKCPEGRSEIIYLPIYSSFPSVLDWVSPLNSTPDYFNRCSINPQVRLPFLSVDGYHEPHSGNACAGVSMFTGHPLHDTADYWAEYLETRLASPMQAGHTYYISYYVCLTTHSGKSYNIISVDNIGARLTAQMIDTNCGPHMFLLNDPPDIHTPAGLFITDTVNWTLVSGIYTATGGEQWLTIGRFYSDPLNFIVINAVVPDIDLAGSTCYMLVDDVCVTDMASPVVTDTMIYTPQFPVAIGIGKAEELYKWYNGDTARQITFTAPGTYARERWSGCGYYIDSFTISEASVDYCVWLPSAFTPNGDGKNDEFGPGNTYCHPDLSDFSFNIYNRWGQLVFQTVDPGIKWDGRCNGAPQEMGVYFYTLRYLYSGAFAAQNKIQGVPTLIKGDVTLVR